MDGFQVLSAEFLFEQSSFVTYCPPSAVISLSRCLTENDCFCVLKPVMVFLFCFCHFLSDLDGGEIIFSKVPKMTQKHF